MNVKLDELCKEIEEEKDEVVYKIKYYRTGFLVTLLHLDNTQTALIIAKNAPEALRQFKKTYGEGYEIFSISGVR